MSRVQPSGVQWPSQWDTSAVHWNALEAADVGTDPGVDAVAPWQTLTVIYDAEGRNAAEAGRFARAIFERERKRAALPLPEALAVFAG